MVWVFLIWREDDDTEREEREDVGWRSENLRESEEREKYWRRK